MSQYHLKLCILEALPFCFTDNIVALVYEFKHILLA